MRGSRGIAWRGGRVVAALLRFLDILRDRVVIVAPAVRAVHKREALHVPVEHVGRREAGAAAPRVFRRVFERPAAGPITVLCIVISILVVVELTQVLLWRLVALRQVVRQHRVRLEESPVLFRRSGSDLPVLLDDDFVVSVVVVLVGRRPLEGAVVLAVAVAVVVVVLAGRRPALGLALLRLDRLGKVVEVVEEVSEAAAEPDLLVFHPQALLRAVLVLPREPELLLHLCDLLLLAQDLRLHLRHGRGPGRSLGGAAPRLRPVPCAARAAASVAAGVLAPPTLRLASLVRRRAALLLLGALRLAPLLARHPRLLPLPLLPRHANGGLQGQRDLRCVVPPVHPPAVVAETRRRLGRAGGSGNSDAATPADRGGRKEEGREKEGGEGSEAGNRRKSSLGYLVLQVPQ